MYAPNGTDPVANAVVYVPENPEALSTLGIIPQRASTCENPGTSVKTKTCSAIDGSFSLSNVPAGRTKIVIAKGLFKKSIDVDVKAGRTTVLTKEQTTLPSTTGSGSQIPRIAVVTGSYDRMEDVLAKLGLGEVDSYGELIIGTEKFTLIDGDGSLYDYNYQTFNVLLDSITELKKYDLIIINCGTYYEDKLIEPQVLTNLRQFVQDGGRLYVTDLSYDYVEQPFPEFVDFFGSDATPSGTAEEMNSAEVGDGGITTNADVLQEGLKNWLGSSVKCGSTSKPTNTENCLNADGTVHIEDFLGGWAVINGPHSGKDAVVTLWTRGNVSWEGWFSGVKPLTLTFSSGSGRVLYSSYHTSGTPHPYFMPQERILQYLIFEMVE